MTQSVFKIGILLAIFFILFPSILFSKEIGSNEYSHVSRQILIRFVSDASEFRKSEIRQEIGAELIKIVKSIRVELWKLPDDVTVDEAMEYLNTLLEVEYVEPNYLYKPQILPNDPQFNKLWFLRNTGQSVNGLSGETGADISAPAAWEIETGNHNIVIAVIDSGVAFDHPDLQNNVWTNNAEMPDNGVDDDNNGYVDDIHGWDFVNSDNNPSDYSRDVYGDGHGTHVAGTIAAEGNNGIGVSGVMWHAQIMPLQIFDLFNQSAFLANMIQLLDIIDAIEYAVNNGAKIINCSFGGVSYSQFQYDILEYANQNGVLVVCAAGNEGNNNDLLPFYPSSYNLSNIISVAATDGSDNLASYSNYGMNSVDVAAPGGSGIRANIYSTIPPERITLFYDDFESTDITWLTSSLYEDWSFVYDSWGWYLLDSVGDYHADENSKAWLEDSIDAGNCRGVVIEYDLSYSLESNYDFLNTEISWDGSNYYSIQEYTGFSDGWLHQTIWYNEFDIGSFYFRFHLETDSLYNYDGVMIDDIKITGIPWIFKGDEYDYKSGTSMAAPVVSGIAGLIWSLKPSLSHLEVKNYILNSVDKIQVLEGTIKAGGRVNAEHALICCLQHIIDFNGDSKTDLFWRNVHDGNNSIWSMHGTGFTSTRLTRIASQDWQVGCFGDFNGDGHQDILWRNQATGQNTIWFMNGLTKVSSGSVYTLPPWTGWELAGSGDFNGDGRTDLFWRNEHDGNNSIWSMNGTGFSSTCLTRIASQDWQVGCIGDFNGDGHQDILWRNESTGQNTIWFMNGLTKMSSGSVYPLPPSSGWELVGSGDFNGDGKTDLFWRNMYDGNNSIWLMNGTGFSSTRLTRVASQDWQVGCIGDFNGDGHQDILWRNEATGQNTIWFMDGLTKTSSDSVYTLPPASGWELQN